MAIVLDNNNFKDTIAKGVSLVDFWAEWCGPCQQMLPILEEFSKDMEGKVNV
jgi:thioredoxin 1